MRLTVALVPVFLLVAGTGYFLARQKENIGQAAIESRATHDPAPIEDRAADEADAELIRQALNSRSLSDTESAALVGAAGRRYMRRKIAYETASQSGEATPEAIESLRKEKESARRLCDKVEAFGRHTDLAAIEAEIEMEQRLTRMGLAEYHDGRLTFTEDDLKQLEREFLSTFKRPLPVSAHGDSSVHRAMGFDHRGRTDVAVNPDTTEGAWLKRYLTAKGVSFYAFRAAVKGKATGAHIHIGPASGRHTPGA
jgi:hypothetical protein